MSKMLRLTQSEYDARRRRIDPTGCTIPQAAHKYPRRGKHENAYWHHAAAYCRSLGVPEPVAEWYFDPDREWRLDLAWPDYKCAIEIDGLWQVNAHTSPMQVARNMVKQNMAVVQGWRVLRCQPDELGGIIMLVANTWLR